MKKTLVLIYLLFIAFSLKSKAQEPAEISTFFNNNFSQWKSHYKIHAFNDLEFSIRIDMAIDASVHDEISEDWITYKKEYQDFFIYAPNKEWFIDLVSGGITVEKTKLGYIGYAEPDQTVLLCREGSKNQILFFGPSCSFQDALFLDNNLAILVGNFNEDNNIYVPFLAVININTFQATTYLGNKNKHANYQPFKGSIFKKIKLQ